MILKYAKTILFGLKHRTMLATNLNHPCWDNCIHLEEVNNWMNGPWYIGMSVHFLHQHPPLFNALYKVETWKQGDKHLHFGQTIRPQILWNNVYQSNNTYSSMLAFPINNEVRLMVDQHVLPANPSRFPTHLTFESASENMLIEQCNSFTIENQSVK